MNIKEGFAKAKTARLAAMVANKPLQGRAGGVQAYGFFYAKGSENEALGCRMLFMGSWRTVGECSGG